MKRVLTVIMCLVMILTLFSGCTKKETSADGGATTTEKETKSDATTTDTKVKEIRLMYQGMEVEQKAIIAAAKKYTEQTGVEINLIYAPHDTYQEQLSGAVAADNVPDIFMLDGPFLPNLVWSGVAAKITPYIDKALLDDMTASNIQQCSYPIDNELYAIAHLDSTVVLYGNKTYLEKIGARIPTSVEDAWTVDEFEGYLEALSKVEGVTFPLDIMRAYGVKSEWGTYGFYPALMSGNGGIMNREIWKADGTLNSQATVDVLQKFQNWSKNGWLVPETAGDNMLFNENRDAALAWCGTWYYPAAEAALGDDLVVMPLPNFGNGTKSPNATWIYAISEKAPEANKVEAGKFLSFMLQDKDFLDTYLNEYGGFPALKSYIASSELFTTGKLAIATEQAAKCAVVREPHPAYPTITSSFMKAFANILDGEDVKASLDQAVKEIDENIADNDGYPPFGQ